VASKITSTTQHLRLFLLLFLLNAAATAEEQKPPTIKPFEIPTYTGKPVDWNHQKPAINPLPKIDGDAIFKVVNRCYPLKSGFGLDISLKTGATYKDTSSNQINTLDSNKYYAGIVANMPLYSDVEIDKDRKLEYQRRMQTTETIKALLTGVATKRRAERLMGLYEALEKRAQERIKNGLAETAEQISFLEKVATTQGELDQANASIEASRLALIGQCRPDAEQEVNDYILSQIK
jgi:hypothetical protein